MLRSWRWGLLVCFALAASCDDASSLGTDAGSDAATHPCFGTGISKGPWAIAVSDTQATVRWEACRAGTDGSATVTPESPPGTPTVAQSVETENDLTVEHDAAFNPNAPPDLPGAWFMHEADLTGLVPATCYDVVLGADASRTARFCTRKASGAPLRFIAIGDTNVGLGPVTSNILSHVIPPAGTTSPDLFLHLGDLMYLTSGFDTWQLWDGVMRPALSRAIYVPAIGNHESATPDEYTDYVMRFFHGAGFGGGNEFYWVETGGVFVFVLDTEDATDSSSTQASWFAQQIVVAEQQPGYRFSIVCFHKPFVTCGDTGDNPAARQFFEPLFLLHKVPLVLQAHMHGYERFDFPGITYVTSAGGGGIIGDPNANVSRSYCGQRVASGGFFHATVLDVSSTTLNGTVIDDSGTVRDTFGIAL